LLTCFGVKNPTAGFSAIMALPVTAWFKNRLRDILPLFDKLLFFISKNCILYHSANSMIYRKM
jgi:hypothetical protein